jgi:hypothetical protein
VLLLRRARYFVVLGVLGELGEVVEPLDPVVPVVPPLPTVPEELPPTPVLPVPVLLPVLPALPPVLEAPRSCRHLSFADWSVSFSQVARAEALSVVPEVTPVDEDEPAAPELDGLEDEPLELDGVDDEPLELDDGVEEEPALDESELDGELELDGRDGEVVLEPDVPALPDPPVVWATATLVAARNAAATAACRIFIVIASLLIGWVGGAA